MSKTFSAYGRSERMIAMQKNENAIEAVERAKKGDQLAFKALYDQYWSYVLFICIKLCRSEEDGKELLQDTFFKAFRNIHQLKDNSKFKPWLSTLATRECYSFLRKKRLLMQSNDEEYHEDFIETDEELLPEVYLEKKELREGLLEIIDNLPPKQREAIYLYYYAGIGTTKIAELQDSNQGNIVKVLHDARKNLRKKLERGGKAILVGGLVSLSTILLAEGTAYAARSSVKRRAVMIFAKIMKSLMWAKIVKRVIRFAASMLVVGTAATVVMHSTELLSAEHLMSFIIRGQVQVAEAEQPITVTENEMEPIILSLNTFIPAELPETMPSGATTILALWGNDEGYLGIPNGGYIVLGSAPETVMPQPHNQGPAAGNASAESGWTFLGWTEDVSNLVVGQPAAGKFVPVNPETMPADAVTIFAVWGNEAGYFGIPNHFSLMVSNFPAGVNPVGQTPVSSASVAYETALNWNPGVAEGWTFLGWTNDISNLVVGQQVAGSLAANP